MSSKRRNMASSNPNWKGGVSRRYSNVTLRPLVLSRDGDRCWICGTTLSKLEIHHLDSNHRNNALDNLRLLCRSCHTKEHGKGKDLKNTFNPAAIRKLPDLQCPICSTTFRPRHSTSRFCSRICQGTYHSAKMQRVSSRNCDHCGKVFTPYHQHGRFCSRKCFGADWSVRLRSRQSTSP
jgi:endogenous inhibitor of DNA gyrase (YacG/DUF329 family)